MASTGTKVRYVRCPKCVKLLIEFTDVPVYKCGGCGTLLQAKYSNSVGNQSHNQLANSSLDNGGDYIADPNLCSTLNAEDNSFDKGESFDAGENGTKEECANTDQLLSNLENISDRLTKEGIEAETGSCLNEDGDDSTKLSHGDSDNLALINKLKDSREPSGDSFASEEDFVDKVRGYDSRNGKVLGSVDSEETEGGNVVENAKMKALLVPKLQNFSLKSSSERRPNIFSSSRGESSSRYRVRAQGRGSSLDSMEYYSVRMEPEGDDWLSRNLSRGSTLGSASVHHDDSIPSTKLNRYEQDRLELCYRRDGERRSHIRPLPRWSYHDQRTSEHYRYPIQKIPFSSHSCYSHCCNGPCRPCPYNLQSNPSETSSHHLHSSESASLHFHSSESHGSGKSLNKERRQSLKRHCLPRLGAAPFIICYKCLKLLQLPADFLMLKKLRCGACSEIQVLPSRMARRDSNQVFRRKVDEQADAVIGHAISVSDRNDVRDSISLSEGHGFLFSESCSPETEAISSDLRDDDEGRNGKKAACITLHHLMGYSSATQLLRRLSEDDGGNENPHSTRPHSRD